MLVGGLRVLGAAPGVPLAAFRRFDPVMWAGLWLNVVTGVLLLCFVGGWIWAWSPRRKREFEDAARLPLDDEQESPR